MAAASSATPSFLWVGPKLVLIVYIDFREDHSRESGDIVNGTKDPLHVGQLESELERICRFVPPNNGILVAEL